MEDAKNYLLAWQDFALKKGYTAVADAGVELFCKNAPQAYMSRKSLMWARNCQTNPTQSSHSMMQAPTWYSTPTIPFHR